MDGGRDHRVVVAEAVMALFTLDDGIAALAELDWHSPAALLFRAVIADLARDCTALRLDLAAWTPEEE
jgi:hypothetical protein